MERTPCEEALTRARAYLTSAGVQIDNAVMITLLRVVENALSDACTDTALNSTALFARVMDKLPEHFDLPELRLPPGHPPLSRSSIGYDPF